MRSILEGKIYLIRNFEKEKLNNLIINNKLTLRIFLQNDSLYRKEHLKYLLSAIDSSGGETSTKKSTVLLCNSLVNSRGSFLSRLNLKSLKIVPGNRMFSIRRLVDGGLVPPAIETTVESPEGIERPLLPQSPASPDSGSDSPTNFGGYDVETAPYPPTPASLVISPSNAGDSDLESPTPPTTPTSFVISPISTARLPLPESPGEALDSPRSSQASDSPTDFVLSPGSREEVEEEVTTPEVGTEGATTEDSESDTDKSPSMFLPEISFVEIISVAVVGI